MRKNILFICFVSLVLVVIFSSLFFYRELPLSPRVRIATDIAFCIGNSLLSFCLGILCMAFICEIKGKIPTGGFFKKMFKGFFPCLILSIIAGTISGSILSIGVIGGTIIGAIIGTILFLSLTAIFFFSGRKVVDELEWLELLRKAAQSSKGPHRKKVIT